MPICMACGIDTDQRWNKDPDQGLCGGYPLIPGSPDQQAEAAACAQRVQTNRPRKWHDPAPRDVVAEAKDWVNVTALIRDQKWHTVAEMQVACGKLGPSPLRRAQAWRDMPGCDVLKAPTTIRGVWQYCLVGALPEQIAGVLSGLIPAPNPQLGPAQSVVHREVKRVVISEADCLWLLQERYPELLSSMKKGS